MRKSLYSKRQGQLLSALKSARKEAGLTQEELAALLKMPQSFVAKTENGERRLDVVEFVSYCEALGASTTSILSELET